MLLMWHLCILGRSILDSIAILNIAVNIVFLDPTPTILSFTPSTVFILLTDNIMVLIRYSGDY